MTAKGIQVPVVDKVTLASNCEYFQNGDQDDVLHEEVNDVLRMAGLGQWVVERRVWINDQRITSGNPPAMLPKFGNVMP